MEESKIDQDSKCYDKIMEAFNNSEDDFIKNKMTKNKAIVSLINNSKCKNDKRFVQNALLIVLSLFEKDLPVDQYESCGCEAQNCTDKERAELIDEMMKIL